MHSVVWHPFTGEIFGLTRGGDLFRWDPHEEEAKAMVQDDGYRHLAISPDGERAATTDRLMVIRVYATNGFVKLCQVPSQDIVGLLMFNSNLQSSWLYDIKRWESSVTVWDTNQLIRLTNCQNRRSSDNGNGEREGRVNVSPVAEQNHFEIEDVTALAIQHLGPLYCYGKSSGVVTLCEVGRGKVCDLPRSGSPTPVTCVAWSQDGNFVASMDWDKLTVQKVTRSDEQQDIWQNHHIFDLAITLDAPEDHKSAHLIFHPAGHKLLIVTRRKVYTIDTESHILTGQSNLSVPLGPYDSKSQWKWTWACHPINLDTLLGFDCTRVHVWNWNDVCETELHPYFPTGLVWRPILTSCDDEDSPGLYYCDICPSRLITSIDSAEALLEVQIESVEYYLTENQYLMFELGETLSPTILPPTISPRIREALAIFPGRMLVFLDVDRWVCTGKLPTLSEIQGNGDSEQMSGFTGVERHYMFPGNWLTRKALRSHRNVMSDGTLIFAWDRDVITVQSASLRRAIGLDC